MRILFCGVAAIALSGCSWMGFGNGHQSSEHSYGNHNTSTYASHDDGCCVGGDRLSTWNLEGSYGQDYIVGGDAITGSATHPNFNFPTTTVANVDMKDAYDTGYRASLGGSYALNPNRKVTVQGFYGKAEGQEVVWGTQGGSDLRGTMSDYKTYGIEAGLRQYAQPVNVPILSSVRPYVEGRLGATHVDAISMNGINQTVATDPNTPTTLNMYEGGWVPTASGMVGLETPLFKRMTVGLETGIRYTGSPRSNNVGMEPTTFNARYAGFNNGGSSYTVPVTLRGRYRF